MVRYEIISMDRIRTMKDEMEMIHPECFDQFVAAVIAWYQEEITNPDKQVTCTSKPPNLFHMFEYPNWNAEIVFDLFVMSDTYGLMERQERNYKDSKDIAVDTFNNRSMEYLGIMEHDVSLVLNGYHLFHCFQDDAQSGARYYNPYAKEVW